MDSDEATIKYHLQSLIKNEPQNFGLASCTSSDGISNRKPKIIHMDSTEEALYCICRSRDTDRFMIGCDRCNEWFHGDCINITESDAKSILQFYCDNCRFAKPSLAIVYKAKKDKKRKESNDDIYSKKEKHKKRTRRCGECTACYQIEDCGRCDFCKDMRKFGGANKIRQKCRYRQCLNFGRAFGQFGQNTKSYSGDDEGTRNDPSYVPEIKNSTPPKKAKPVKPAHKKVDRKKFKKSKRSSSVRKTDKKSEGHHDFSVTVQEEESLPKQCYGPGCTLSVRTGSKYCSDDCGMKLATNRIYEILPHRLQQWQATPCMSEENNKKELDRIRRQQLETREALALLDKRHQSLDSIVERGKLLEIDKNLEQQEGDMEESDLSTIYCVTCGHETNTRNALRHFEKCFNKYESQTSFGSVYKTRIEGQSMFCDFYNPSQGSYCKRLRVLCPEHLRDPKVTDDEVCGCPLSKDVFSETGELCLIAKKKCTKHYCWEKLRRAEIEMERVREWLRIDELFEQERNIRVALANRAGVLGLMLHQTVDHDALLSQSTNANIAAS